MTIAEALAQLGLTGRNNTLLRLKHAFRQLVKLHDI